MNACIYKHPYPWLYIASKSLKDKDKNKMGVQSRPIRINADKIKF